jgi:hypothetical protein
VPPFIRWSRSRDGTEGYFPWPFVQTASGSKDKLYLWPFWGTKATANERDSFWVWPIVSKRQERFPNYAMDRFTVLPILYMERQAKKMPAEAGVTNTVTARYVKVWPLGSYQREGEALRWRALDLWPPKNTPQIERNFAPLWTLYSHVRTSEGAEDELLWGLFRWRRDAEGGRRGSLFPLVSWSNGGPSAEEREWSLLKGLVGYRRSNDERSYRLLYLIHWGAKP